VRASINAGFSRVFWTLFDTHIAALISGGVPVPVRHRPDSAASRSRCSSVLVSNLFTSIFVSKTLFELALGKRQQVAALSI
jgi:preprotein translocase subunit SecD